MLPPPRKKPNSCLPPRKKSGIEIQQNLLEIEDTKKSSYTQKILAPIYEPKNRKPNVIELVNRSKTKRLIEKIEMSNIIKDEKQFLIDAAGRHNVFNYKLIADYYAHASPVVQSLMEESALVIIDFKSAIQNGYIQFNEEIKELYRRETNH